MPDPKTETPKRLHHATYARDKKNPGKYLIRVQGPTAAKFRKGREIPVTHMDRSESMETLDTCIWTGVDEASGEPVALYSFEQKPREEPTDDQLPF